MAPSVQRYSFIGRDRVEDDPDGRYLPDVAAALSYAAVRNSGAAKKSGFNDSTLVIVARDQAGQTVLFFMALITTGPRIAAASS
jgi:hypothetical protein